VPVGAPATAETADAVAAAHTAPGVVRDASRAAYEVASGVNAVAQYELQVGDRFIMSATRPLSDVGVYTATARTWNRYARINGTSLSTPIVPPC